MQVHLEERILSLKNIIVKSSANIPDSITKAQVCVYVRVTVCPIVCTTIPKYIHSCACMLYPPEDKYRIYIVCFKILLSIGGRSKR